MKITSMLASFQRTSMRKSSIVKVFTNEIGFPRSKFFICKLEKPFILLEEKNVSQMGELLNKILLCFQTDVG